MAICRWCESEIPGDSSHCPYCGQIYEPTQPCEKCGLPIPRGVRVCANCGHFVDYEAPQPEPGQFESDTVTAPSGDSISAWPAADLEEDRSVARTKEYYPADPVYYVALLVAAFSILFIWASGFNIALASVSIFVSLVGYYRLHLYGERYGQLWVNIVATSLGGASLVIGILFQVGI